MVERAQREVILTRWIQPSSADEQTQQDRALRMVRDAIRAWPSIQDSTSYSVYAKGSYANNTNVRRDSDVDIVVENRDLFYYEYFECQPLPGSHTSPYVGRWSPPGRWRDEVVLALRSAFPNEIDASGDVAINIPSRPGSRPPIDVVPSFEYHRYDSSDHSISYQGSRVYKRSGDFIDNYPEQQSANGKIKNAQTGHRYKNFVRALKNAENQLASQGQIEELPSYFMECLIWNVPNHVLTQGYSLDLAFKATLVWLWQHLNQQYVITDWSEPNNLKYLFRGHSKWTVDDARRLVAGTWNYLGYDS